MARNVKRIRVVGGWLLALLLAGCSVAVQPASRQQLVENLGPIVELEKRAALLTKSVEVLASIGKIREIDAQALKESLDVYFVYHRAATVLLAEGRINAYKSHVAQAGKELDSVEVRLLDLARRSAGEDEAEKGRARIMEF